MADDAGWGVFDRVGEVDRTDEDSEGFKVGTAGVGVRDLFALGVGNPETDRESRVGVGRPDLDAAGDGLLKREDSSSGVSDCALLVLGTGGRGPDGGGGRALVVVAVIVAMSGETDMSSLYVRVWIRAVDRDHMEGCMPLLS